MANYKKRTMGDQDIFNDGSYGHQKYWEKYYDNPGYFCRTAPKFARQFPAVGRRSYDHSSTDLNPQNRKQSSSVRKSRIAIIVAVVVTICAIIAAIIVAVYFTSIPDRRNESKAIIRKVEVTRLKTYQGEVGLAKEWNENLTDPASPVYKQEANNFISAMDKIYRNSPYKDTYKGTVVDGFRSGSTFVKCRILWTGIYIQEIETSATLGNEQIEQVISEREINQVDTDNLIKLIKDELPNLLGTSLTATPVLQVLMSTIAPVSTGKPATAAPITVKSTTSKQAPLNRTASQPSSTTTIAAPTTITVKSTPTTLMSKRATTATSPKSNTNTTTTPTSASRKLNSTTNTEDTTTTQPTTILTTSKSTTAITTSNPPFTSTAVPQPSITGTTQIPGTTSTSTMPKSTMSSTTTPEPNKAIRLVLKKASNITQQLAASVACQFEDAYKCGYRNLQPNALWNQRSGNFFKLPPYDHTYGNDTGQFLVAYNNSRLDVYYNEISTNGPEYPYKIEYFNPILSSPQENFMTESCVYFYYYLNGTAVRPNPLSAQLYVYVNDSSGRRLEWYDHVNRTISGWLKGWVSVQPGHANVIFEAKTVTTTTVWPGVVALDDVTVSTGSCPDYPDCGPDTFRCTTTRVCISVDLQCDGGNDCVDGSDEENCISKPDYQVKLINGDGSYGSIAIFYQGLWRPVCMHMFKMMEGRTNTVQLACTKMGYLGRFQAAFANSRGGFVNSWHHPVRFAMKVSCDNDHVDISNCSMNLTRTGKRTRSCYYYQAAFCSNDVCFSGERVCPPDHINTNHSSSPKCISHSYFCDGITDCPGGTDELNCANCSTSDFECTNHECVPSSQRCDGTPQCGDKSDEYGCVIVTNNMSQIYHSHLSAYLPVCYSNTNNILANILCSLSGQGSSTYYQSTSYGQGTVLTAHSNATTSIVPGYTISIEPCFHLLLQCASFECGTTLFGQKKLPKILHGRDAVLGQLPWQIALYGNETFDCGGSIIHPNWVITAAHCIKHLKLYSVRAGAVDVGPFSSDDFQGQLYSSSRIHIHPFYNGVDHNDISLLYFSQPIAFNDYVRPICIASRKTVEEMLNAGYKAECYVSGWGYNHNYINEEIWLRTLQMVRVQLYRKEECDQIYYNVNNAYPQNITVCVDNQNFGAPTCNGDSGGPLICRNKNGRFEIFGTLSWGFPSCFQDGYPDIYQLSYPHADWIEKITGLAFSGLTMDLD